jgi:peptidyl-prolyl cis-trans isomerase SDCCAG10
MSQVYSTEPQTVGRVIFETTHGPLEIQLWSRECPWTTKYFLQLCLDGYYENALFHRIVPNFLVQTGALRYDPVARKSSQKEQVTSLDHKSWKDYRERTHAEQAMERRQYELNTRIRFNHRGQVAMALPVDSEGMGEDDMAAMQPQFFITLDGASELDGKHVCFGTVTGPTVFNALRIGNTDVDEQTGQPTILEEAPRIERVKILENPIHSDIVPSPGILPWKIAKISGDADAKGAKKKRKAIKNLNVLSFGDEMEQHMDDGVRGIKSSHDLVDSKRLSKKVDKRVLEAVSKIDDEHNENAPVESPLSKKTKLSGKRGMAVASHNITADRIDGHLPDDGTAVSRQPAFSQTDQSAYQVDVVPPKEGKTRTVSLVEARRNKYAKTATKDKKKREEDTMAKFMAFQSKLGTKKKPSMHAGATEDGGIVTRMVRRTEKAEVEEDPPANNDITYHGQILENDEEIQGDWIQTKFLCRKHQDLDARLGGDGRDAMDDYKVIDEKERGGGDRKGRNKHRHHHHSRK